MTKFRSYWTYGLISAAALFILIALGYGQFFETDVTRPPSLERLTSDFVATQLKDHLNQQKLPLELPLQRGSNIIETRVDYTIEPALQIYVSENLRKWGPDYAAFVALDASTGRILAMASYQRKSDDALGHLALRSTYPAASVFKVITAAAAIENNKFSANSLIPFTGSYHTLYRRNVLKEMNNRWTRNMTFKEAFAKSVNSVFGKIGVFHVGPPVLKKFAQRFMFNSKLQTDFPVSMGGGIFEEEDPWSVAEVASGFTRNTTLNPVQGAMIAASVINDGVMMTPYLVESIASAKGEVLYRSTPTVASVPMSESTARHMQELMRETVITGTSSRAFRPLRRRRYFSDIEVGGKTGSLTGASPAGKYDWYVGYARQEEHAIAVAALTINTNQWRVKSSQLASEFVVRYFEKFAPGARVHSTKTSRTTAAESNK